MQFFKNLTSQGSRFLIVIYRIVKFIISKSQQSIVYKIYTMYNMTLNCSISFRVKNNNIVVDIQLDFDVFRSWYCKLS